MTSLHPPSVQEMISTFNLMTDGSVLARVYGGDSAYYTAQEDVR